MRKVLIANRGEIAVRIARACRAAGLASVAVYAVPDREAVHVRAADEAVPLNGATPADTYLDMGKVLRAAADSGADALHPGYGFLAESAGFAQAALDAGLTWIGPPPAAIRRLGDKLSARRRASSSLAGTARSPSLRRTQGSRSHTRSARKSPGSTWSWSHSGSPKAAPSPMVTRGHALQFRIYAEDPARGFAPTWGTVRTWRPPSGIGVRLDSGTEQGSVVVPVFGTLLAKLIVTGASREEALHRARRALQEFEVTGLATSLPLHRALVAHEAFAPPDPARPFSVHTGWIESNWPGSAPPGA
jgi:acetyl-CoA/propionyl-CoA carboxylase biotin carboxyl carrier protein